jgi:hypothetical protein
VGIQGLAGRHQIRVGKWIVFTVEAQQSWDIDNPLIHLSPLGFPWHLLQEIFKDSAGATQPAGQQVDPGASAKRLPGHHPAQRPKGEMVGRTQIEKRRLNAGHSAILAQVFDCAVDYLGVLDWPWFPAGPSEAVDVGVLVGCRVVDWVGRSVGRSVGCSVGCSVGSSVVGGGSGGGALARVSSILVSRSTVAPARGLWSMTVPAGWELSRRTNSGSPKPAFLASRIAAPRLKPWKFGTSDLPVAYRTVILLSSGTVEPSLGEMLITSPGLVSGSSLLAATVLTLLNFRSSRVFSTSLTSSPTRPSGMVPVLVPSFKVIVTMLFTSTSVPPTGSCSVIVPLVSSLPLTFLTST